MVRNRLWAAPIAVLTVLSAFAGDSIDPDAFEPDDAIAQATPIALNSEQTGHSIHFHTVNPGPDTFDVDYVTFELDEEMTVLLDTPNAFGYQSAIRAMPISVFNTVSVVGTAAPARVIQLPAGTYFASVTGVELFQVSGIVPWYSILLRDASLPDIYEDDDTSATASYLAYGGDSQYHNFDSDSDVDWMRYTVGAGGAGQTTVRISPLNGAFPPPVTVYRVVQGQLELFAPSFSSASIYEFPANSATAYFIRVQNPQPGRSTRDTYYRIEAEFTFHANGTMPPGTIAGVVTSTQSGPIPGAVVRIAALGNAKVTTNNVGLYSFPSLRSAAYSVEVSRAGYYGSSLSTSVSNGNISVLNIALEPLPAEDLNGDAAVDAVDIQLVINAVLGLGGEGDVNADSATDSVDIQLVINAALGL